MNKLNIGLVLAAVFFVTALLFAGSEDISVSATYTTECPTGCLFDYPSTEACRCNYFSPICIDGGECKECEIDDNCNGVEDICSDWECVECVIDDDCSSDNPVCREDNRCGCENDYDCGWPTPVCINSSELCGCETSDDCNTNEVCTDPYGPDSECDCLTESCYNDGCCPTGEMCGGLFTPGGPTSSGDCVPSYHDCDSDNDCGIGFACSDYDGDGWRDCWYDP